MACLITSGYSVGCLDNFGGVKEVYIAPFDSTDVITVDPTSGIVTTISTSGSPAGPIFYTFEQDIEIATFTDNATTSVENGTNFFEASVQISLNKLSQPMKNQIKSLVQGAWRVMVLDQAGVYHLLGVTNKVRCTTTEMGVGKAAGDMNGAKLTFTVKEGIPTPTVETSAAIASII